MHRFEYALPLEGFFGVWLACFIAGPVSFGFHLSGLFGVVFVGVFVVGWVRFAETWARRAERPLDALRRPGHVGGAVGRPP